MTKASVIVCGYNKVQELAFCLHALTCQNFPHDYEIIVIDDGSTDATQEIVHEFALQANVRYVMPSENSQGLSVSRNTGAKLAKSSILIFLDADIVVCRNFLRAHYLAHQNPVPVVNLGLLHAVGISDKVWDRTAFLARFLNPILKLMTSQSKIGRHLKKLWINKLHHNDCWSILNWPRAPLADWDFNDNVLLFERLHAETIFPDLRACWLRRYGKLMSLPAPWALLWGGNFSICKTVLQKVGFFDERICKYGSEDIELGYRLHCEGIQFHLDINAVGFHYPHPRNTKKNRLAEEQNNHYFLKKHPTISVEFNRVFGCYNVNNKLTDVSQTLRNTRYGVYDKLCPTLLNALPGVSNKPRIIVGAGSGHLLHIIDVEYLVEGDYEKYQDLAERYPIKIIQWLLGIGLPTEDHFFSYSLITDIWYQLCPEMRKLMLQEAMRSSDRVFLLISQEQFRNASEGHSLLKWLWKPLLQQKNMRSKGNYCLIEIERRSYGG